MSDLIKDEVSRLLLREVRDPRVGFVTVTGTAISPDLKSVRVFVSVLGDAPAREACLQALNSAAGFFRKNLFKNLRLRSAPSIVFVHDDSIDRGDRIERVLRQIHEADRPADAEEEEE